jgi:hypothetical protein
MALHVQSAELTNSVNLTTNLTLYLRNTGVADRPQSVFNSNEMIWRMLTGASTNLVFFRGLPMNQSYEFHLFDANGREVKKTELGKKNSADGQLPSKPEKLKPALVSSENTAFNQLFRPDDMFVITNSGNYQLEVRMRICVPMTNGLPDNAVMMNSFAFIPDRNLGILTSPPLRVEVIKK